MLLQVGALEALVKLGCDPKIKDSVASTPMHVAAGEGHIDAILKLVDLVRVMPLLACLCQVQLHMDPLVLACCSCLVQTAQNMPSCRWPGPAWPGLAWPGLALPCLALPCLALPCLALPCLALPCLPFPSLPFPSLSCAETTRISHMAQTCVAG